MDQAITLWTAHLLTVSLSLYLYVRNIMSIPTSPPNIYRLYTLCPANGLVTVLTGSILCFALLRIKTNEGINWWMWLPTVILFLFTVCPLRSMLKLTTVWQMEKRKTRMNLWEAILNVNYNIVTSQFNLLSLDSPRSSLVTDCAIAQDSTTNHSNKLVSFCVFDSLITIGYHFLLTYFLMRRG